MLGLGKICCWSSPLLQTARTPLLHIQQVSLKWRRQRQVLHPEIQLSADCFIYGHPADLAQTPRLRGDLCYHAEKPVAGWAMWVEAWQQLCRAEAVEECRMVHRVIEKHQQLFCISTLVDLPIILDFIHVLVHRLRAFVLEKDWTLWLADDWIWGIGFCVGISTPLQGG